MRQVVDIDTADGPMELRTFPPRGVPRGGVIVYMDAFGLRPEWDDICARYAGAGWLALLPDLYHRLPRRHFAMPADHASPLDPGMAEANDATTLDRVGADTAAVLDHAARRHRLTRFGAVGHCMGARHALTAAARFPAQVKAAACLHGGRMVWDGPDSPHLAIPGCQGGLYIAMARDDATCPELHQQLLEAGAAQAGPQVQVERVNALHGWTFPERWCHDRSAAEHSFGTVQVLFARWVQGTVA